jgi:hypothetical protein
MCRMCEVREVVSLPFVTVTTCWAASCSHFVERFYPLSFAASPRSRARHKTTRTKIEVFDYATRVCNINIISRFARLLSAVPAKAIPCAWPFPMKTSSTSSQMSRCKRRMCSYPKGLAALTSLFSPTGPERGFTATTSLLQSTCK